MTNLFDSIKVGDIELPNRVFMAPMSRHRARPNGIPSEFAVEYYRQRASAGLIISEAVQINSWGGGYMTPGIHTPEQVAEWRKITDAVHAEGGAIFAQLWHVGRVTHPSIHPDGPFLAPSAIQANCQTTGGGGAKVDVIKPRAFTLSEIADLLEDYRQAAVCAKEAGFDGVELHAANGYLLDQFIRDCSNQRNDQYGGSAENRSRFVVEVASVVADVFGADRVGIRFSPTGSFGDMSDGDPLESFGMAIDELNKLGLAFLHMVEIFFDETTSPEQHKILDALKAKWKTTYIANGGFDGASGKAFISEGKADAIAYGRPFIANPDLPKRLEIGAELNEVDRDTTYGGDHRGYTDYPFLPE